jgi:hypothetical protein
MEELHLLLRSRWIGGSLRRAQERGHVEFLRLNVGYPTDSIDTDLAGSVGIAESELGCPCQVVFMQVAWPIIHPVLMAAFDAWWCLNTRNFHDVNGVLMVLLPKNKEPAIVRDYRPISLIHIVGKLFSKVLVSHLAPKLGELVQPNQSAFVMGWLIHDSFKFIQSSA